MDMASGSVTVPPTTTLNRKEVLAWLEKNVPKARIRHILRVETYAIELARQHQLDVERTAQAAFLHDLAKYFKPQRLLAIARAEGFPLDAVYRAEPRLLHADVGAVIARTEFQVHDPEVLDAIANHTLGQSPMSLMSCAVFLADSLEPGRGDNAELKQLRKVSLANLYEAVWLVCDRTMEQLLRKKKLIHPRMVMTRNWAMGMVKHTAES
jgi:predicted HD superfamily hydrolase involved in NAD metabolism